MRSLDARTASAQQAAGPRYHAQWSKPSAPAAPRSRIVHLPRLPARVWQSAAAAAAVLFAVWVFVGGPGPDGSNQATQEAPRQAAADPAAQSGPETAAPPPGPAAQPPPNPVATLILAPTLTRDRGATPTLVIGVDVVPQLQLTLDPPVHPTYRVVLRTADGAGWRADGLQPVSTTAGETLVITLPVGLLDDDDYIVTPSGVTADGEAEAAAGYYFRAQRR